MKKSIMITGIVVAGIVVADQIVRHKQMTSIRLENNAIEASLGDIQREMYQKNFRDSLMLNHIDPDNYKPDFITEQLRKSILENAAEFNSFDMGKDENGRYVIL